MAAINTYVRRYAAIGVAEDAATRLNATYGARGTSKGTLAKLVGADFRNTIKYEEQIRGEVSKRYTERLDMVGRLQVELEGLIVDLKTVQDFRNFMASLLKRNPFREINTDVLIAARTELVTQLKRVLVLDIAPVDKYQPVEGDFGELTEEEVMGLLYDPVGYSPDQLVKKIRQLHAQLHEQQNVEVVEDVSVPEISSSLCFPRS